MRSTMKNPLVLLLVTLFAAPIIRAQGTTSPEHLLVIRAELPQYPVLAKTARVSGNVKVTVTVKDGDVVAVEATSGNPLLTSATKDNVRTWKFDKAVNATFATTFMYQLEKQESSQPSNPKIELELPTLVKIRARPSVGPCHDCGSDITPKLIEHEAK